MNPAIPRSGRRVAAACHAFAITACGGGNDDPSPAPPPRATSVGPEGGTAGGPSGAQVVVLVGP